MQAATDLPLPQDQRRLDLEGDASTSFELKTIRQERAKDDEVRVQYAFYNGTEQLDGTGWGDRFSIRVFGWQDKALASVVFTNQNSKSEFEPTAALSWILSNNRWPAENASGIKGMGSIRWLSGFGVSTMPLNFDPSQSVELGIAGTVSLINDRLLFGYGANLQSSQNKGFWFFAFRLFSTPGFVQTKK